MTERITHGRHCICSACAAQDWTEPQLAACGMHGPSCPPVYAPLGAAGDALAAHALAPEQEAEQEGQRTLVFCIECKEAGRDQRVTRRWGAWICPVHGDRGHVEHRPVPLAPEQEADRPDDDWDFGPFDPDELVRWAETYGHPEHWAARAKALHAKLDALPASLPPEQEEWQQLCECGHGRFLHVAEQLECVCFCKAFKAAAPVSSPPDEEKPK